MTLWLVDKSAYVRMQSGQAAQLQEWSGRIERGLIEGALDAAVERFRNAIDQASREISTRFDFKGTDSSIELGTNDIGLAANSSQLNAATLAANWWANHLAATKKCVVWVGLNENGSHYFGGPGGWYNNPYHAAAFDNTIKAAVNWRAGLGDGSRLRYADYTALVRNNAYYRFGLSADGIHPRWDTAKNQLVGWYAQQIRNQCGI